MKKILIMMALIVGFGVSVNAQEHVPKPKVINLNVELLANDGYNIDVMWNTKRATKTQFRLKKGVAYYGKDGIAYYNDNEWKDAKVKMRAYTISMPKPVKEATYQITAENDGHVTFKKVRVLEIESAKLYGDDYIDLTLRVNVVQNLVGKNVYVAINNSKAKITNVEKNLIRIKISDAKFLLTDIENCIKYEFGSYLWFKQSI